MGTTHSNDSADARERGDADDLQEFDEFDMANQICAPAAVGARRPLPGQLRQFSRQHLHSEVAGILGSGDTSLDSVYDKAHAMATYARGFASCEALEARAQALCRVHQAITAQNQARAAAAAAAVDQDTPDRSRAAAHPAAGQPAAGRRARGTQELQARALAAAVEMQFVLARDLRAVAPHAMRNVLGVLHR
jgi:hypothetical protein